MYIMYTNNYILEVPYEDELRQIVAGVKTAGFYITEEVDF